MYHNVSVSRLSFFFRYYFFKLIVSHLRRDRNFQPSVEPFFWFFPTFASSRSTCEPLVWERSKSSTWLALWETEKKAILIFLIFLTKSWTFTFFCYLPQVGLWPFRTFFKTPWFSVIFWNRRSKTLIFLFCVWLRFRRSFWFFWSSVESLIFQLQNNTPSIGPSFCFVLNLHLFCHTTSMKVTPKALLTQTTTKSLSEMFQQAKLETSGVKKANTKVLTS